MLCLGNILKIAHGLTQLMYRCYDCFDFIDEGIEIDMFCSLPKILWKAGEGAGSVVLEAYVLNHYTL